MSIDMKGKKKCIRCGFIGTYPCFKFTGQGKLKKGAPGTYRSDYCLNCHKKGGMNNV